jgi:hypothetical protein
MEKLNLNLLKKEIPYKWKIESLKGYKATCVSYIDARAVMDLLDEVVCPANWSDSYGRCSKGGLFCTISIKVGAEWISKADIGVAGNFEKEKGEASDSFKRAAVKWGVGRFLYSIPFVQLPKKEYKKGSGKFYPTSLDGKDILFSNEEITAYINDNIAAGAAVEPTKEVILAINSLQTVEALKVFYKSLSNSQQRLYAKAVTAKKLTFAKTALPDLAGSK